MTRPEQLPFDSVRVSIDGKEQSLALRDFLSLPFHERVRAILAGAVAFYDGDRVVDTQAGLQALRRMSADARSRA
jgi:hypothetical protein